MNQLLGGVRYSKKRSELFTLSTIIQMIRFSIKELKRISMVDFANDTFQLMNTLISIYHYD